MRNVAGKVCRRAVLPPPGAALTHVYAAPRLHSCLCFSSKTLCQQELDLILERISKMPFRDNRGPLEDLYALHIPNCDKRGQYNLKQVAI